MVINGWLQVDLPWQWEQWSSLKLQHKYTTNINSSRCASSYPDQSLLVVPAKFESLRFMKTLHCPSKSALNWRGTTTTRLCSVCFISQIILGFSHRFLFTPTRKWHLLDSSCKSSELFISVVDVCLHVCWVHECVFIPGQSSVQHHPPTMTSVLTLSFLPLFL